MIVDLLITNANIVNADGTTRGHIAISDGQIAAIHPASTPEHKLPEATRVVVHDGSFTGPGPIGRIRRRSSPTPALSGKSL